MGKRFKYCRKDIKQTFKNGAPYVRLSKNLTALNPDRVMFKFGAEGYYKDGLIEIRKDHPDYMDLGEDRKFAQVRIAVGDRHFIKGVAIYGENVPDGFDLVVYKAIPAKRYTKLDLRKGGNIFRTVNGIERLFITKNGEKIPSPINLVDPFSWANWKEIIT